MTTIDEIVALASQGVGRLNVEAEIGRRMSAEELVAFRRAETSLKLARAAKKARGPLSVAERVRRHVASRNDVEAFDPRPRHPRLRAACRDNLALFIWYYCRSLLHHRPSELVRDGLIRDVQEVILHGGQSVKLYGRGTGKTTIIVYCAITWAVLYGHRRYPVIISATGKLAKKNLNVIKNLLARSDAIAQDFPAIAQPIRALGGVAQRAASQTYGGVPTDILWGSDQIVLPSCRDESGALLDAGSGAIIGSAGIGGAVRGANEGGQRPDFLVLDDPQTKKVAHSPALVKGVVDYIHGDALMLAGHDRSLAAFVTITPQVFGDVATELTSSAKHPEWDVSVEPFLRRKCPGWDKLVTAFVGEYIADMAAHDMLRTRSTAWYKSHRDACAGCVVLDPLQYDASSEVDAIHHLLNLRARMGERAFNAEILVTVSADGGELELTPDAISERLNGSPRNVLPPGTDQVVVFVDVNITKTRGLSWAAVAFGPQRVAAVVNYGRYPAAGALVPPNSSDLVRNRLVAAGVSAVIDQVSRLPLRDSRGRRVSVTALGVDRGYLPAVIHRTLYVLRRTRPIPFPVVAVRGFPWDKFGVREKDTLRRGDHVFATRSKFGQYLAQMSPYWREIMQSGFLETPLQPGSLSLFGSSAAEHFALALEVANEKLVRKYSVIRSGKQLDAWDWQTRGENHFCDCLSGAFALASWYHAYDNLAQMIDGVVVSPAAVPLVAAGKAHQDDLFDPLLNPAVNPASTYDALHDETEGTLDDDVEPHENEIESLENPLRDASAARKLSSRCKQNVRKFKRGKFRR